MQYAMTLKKYSILISAAIFFISEGVCAANYSSSSKAACRDVFSSTGLEQTDFEKELEWRLATNDFQITRGASVYTARLQRSLPSRLATLHSGQTILDTGAGYAMFLTDYLNLKIIGSINERGKRGPDYDLPPVKDRAAAIAISLKKPEDWQPDLNSAAGSAKLSYKVSSVGEYASAHPQSVDLIVDVVGASVYAPLEFLSAVGKLLKPGGAAYFTLQSRYFNDEGRRLYASELFSLFKGFDVYVDYSAANGEMPLLVRNTEQLSMPLLEQIGPPEKTQEGPIYSYLVRQNN